MWSLVIFSCLTITWAEAQNGRGPQHQDHNGHGWDIRLAVPGEPGNDYPTLGAIPRTSFSCAGKEPGYYADLETNCQVFRVCTVGSTYGFQSFLCPNGTLFNQAVFVCDWWMNVNCKNAQQSFRNNNEQFENLRLGPQLMKDIKKMLTHPMLNPYDKSSMKGNLIVMQEYKPPFGQLFPNGALLAGPERAPNNVYVPAKQIQHNFIQSNANDFTFSASTPDPRYIPAPLNPNTIPLQRDTETFQRQRQNSQFSNAQNTNYQYTQNSQTGNLISNGHAGRFLQNTNTELANSNGYPQTQAPRPTQITNSFTHVDNYQSGNAQNFQRGQGQYSKQRVEPRRLSQLNNDAAFPKRQNSEKSNNNLDNQSYTYSAPSNLPQFSNNVENGAGNGLKQNLVSTNKDVPSTVITKTLTYSRLVQEPKMGKPKSRITIKTWIVKPTKAAKLIAEPAPYKYSRPSAPSPSSPSPSRLIAAPTPYTYERPSPPSPSSPSPTERVIDENSPYVYEKPTAASQTENIISVEPESESNSEEPYVYNKPTHAPKQIQTTVGEKEEPYVYNKPTLAPKQIQSTEREEEEPYVYNKPTLAPKQIQSTERDEEEPYFYNKPTLAPKQIQTTEIETTRIYIAPTSIPTRPTLLARLNLPRTSALPTKASRLYLTPSPFTSNARFYLPPPRSPTSLPRLYLSPNAVQQPAYYQSAQIRALPDILSPTRQSFNENIHQPSFTLTKHSRINANHNNLTFADILTKEKLDITVNDIVKDTDDILKTASPPQYSQYRKEFTPLDYSESNYLTSRTTTDSGENLTSQVPIPTVSSKSSRIIGTPARSLEPPNESDSYQNYNPLANLPFFKESARPSTIERTVSIKITIPERIANYLFKNQSDSDYDKLEILNTGSSNYLVLSNNLQSKKTAFNFTPIAKLIGNKNSNNISDSQALVYSFLTDSLNVAREYNNIAQQEILSSTSTPAQAQFKNLNSEQLSQITNEISQLTSSQYSNNLNNFDKSAHDISIQKTNTNQPTQFAANAKYTDEQTQAQQMTQFMPSQQTQGELYSSRLQTPNGQQNLINQNQLSSGQLYQWPVSDVTNQVYNMPKSANLVNPMNIQQQTTQMYSLQRNTNQNNAVNNAQQSNPQFEVVKAHTVQFSPAKLQLEPFNESQQISSDENLKKILNSENGISAHLQDKIVGTIPHPLEENKLLTYKKDQSYYLYTQLEDNQIEQNISTKQNALTNTQQNAKLIQNTNKDMPNLVSFQLIPSVSYELEDEKEQQNILNAFQIDEFGAPRDIIKPKNEETGNQQQELMMTSNVNFSVVHPTASKENEQYRINTLYSGPSSYTAPQSSVGTLGSRQVIQNNFISRLEDLSSNNNNGYSKERPARQFHFKLSN